MKNTLELVFLSLSILGLTHLEAANIFGNEPNSQAQSLNFSQTGLENTGSGNLAGSDLGAGQPPAAGMKSLAVLTSSGGDSKISRVDWVPAFQSGIGSGNGSSTSANSVMPDQVIAPEPNTASLMVLGLSFMAWLGWSKRLKTKA